jgi:hypothetical protein
MLCAVEKNCAKKISKVKRFLAHSWKLLSFLPVKEQGGAGKL